MLKMTFQLGVVLALTGGSATTQNNNRTVLKWEQAAPGVWRSTVGKPDSLTLLEAAGSLPRMQGLKSLPSVKFPLPPSEVEARLLKGKIALRFPLSSDEEIYGLGVDFKTLGRTGSTFQLHVDHWGGRTGRTHAPVPFYVSSKGYGVLVNSSRYLNFNVGVGVRLAAKEKPPVIDRTTEGKRWSSMPRSDSLEALVPAEGVEIFVFGGPSPMDAVRRYNLWNGGGPLPPKWGLGYMTRTPTGYSDQDALHEIEEFRARGIPLDMLGLEPGWQDQAYPCSLEWDKRRFADPSRFLAELEKQHVRANLWFNPYISPKAPLYAQLLPYAGSHLVWNGIVPDYSMPEARRLFRQHLEDKIIGLNPAALGGFKIDEVDGYDQWLWPDLAVFPSGNDAEQLRQTYGLLLQKLIVDAYRKHNQRTFGMVRGTNAGASPLPFVIYNDNYAFDEYITAVVNSSFAGALWSPEVRGGDGEDMLRRTQAVCFSPLALFNGWATNVKLWTHAAVFPYIRDAIALRMRLLPYWYTTFAQYHFQGTPVVRALPLLESTGRLDRAANPGETGRMGAVKDQFMVGDALLVAPIAPGAKSRKIVLPPGRWFDFYTGALAGEGGTLEVEPPLSRIPLLVKDGAIIPMIDERLWAPGPADVVSLEAKHFGESPGSILVYDDDGETYNYEKGEFCWTRIEVTRDAAGAWKGTIAMDPNGKKWRYSGVKWTFMTRP